MGLNVQQLLARIQWRDGEDKWKRWGLAIINWLTDEEPHLGKIIQWSFSAFCSTETRIQKNAHSTCQITPTLTLSRFGGVSP